MEGTGGTGDSYARLREEIASNPNLFTHPQLVAKPPVPDLPASVRKAKPPAPDLPASVASVRPTKTPAPLPQTVKQPPPAKAPKWSPAQLGIYGPEAAAAAGAAPTRNVSRQRGRSPGPQVQRERPLTGTGWPPLAQSPGVNVPKQCHVPPPPPAPKRQAYQEQVHFTPGKATSSGLRNRSLSPSFQRRQKAPAPSLTPEEVPRAMEYVNPQSAEIGAVINLGNTGDDHVPRLREWTPSLSTISASIPEPPMSLEEAKQLDDETLIYRSLDEFLDSTDKYFPREVIYGDWVDFTNRVIFYATNTRKLFFFSSVLLQRQQRKWQEDIIRGKSKCHDSLYQSSRKLTAVMRHSSEYYNVCGWYAISELCKWKARGSHILRTFLASNPKALAILVTCMPKSRFMMSLGPSDVYDHNPETILFLGCTHGHSIDRDFDPRLVGSAPDETMDCKYAVHATTRQNYHSILSDGAMRTDDRKSRINIHFARVGEGQTVETVEQLKTAPILIWLDLELACEDYDVRVNSNNVVLVRTSHLPVRYFKWVSDWDARGQRPFPLKAPADSGIEEVLLGRMGKFYRLPELSGNQGQQLLAICNIATESFLNSMDDEPPWENDNHPDPAFEKQEQIRSSAEHGNRVSELVQGLRKAPPPSPPSSSSGSSVPLSAEEKLQMLIDQGLSLSDCDTETQQYLKMHDVSLQTSNDDQLAMQLHYEQMQAA